MKRVIAAAVLLGAAAVAGAATMESVRASAGDGFFGSAATIGSAIEAARALGRARSTRVETPTLRPVVRGLSLGGALGQVDLAAQLDRNLRLMSRVLGTRTFDVGLAGDAGLQTRFLSFTDASGTTFGAIGSLGNLRGAGVNVRIDASTVYNFRIQIGSIFDDPVHKSTLFATPAAGTRGPSYAMTTGELLDMTRAKSALVVIDGEEYEIFYGRDVRSDGGGFSGARGFLFTHEAGLSTKLWPIEESSLPVGVPTQVGLGRTNVVLTRTADGKLLIDDAN